jgi:hypothetical protein
MSYTNRDGYEETLRLIATLPAPEGLEDRVQAGLGAAPRAGRVLAWPVAAAAGGAWMRSAAAAAIVFVVAGGGWGIYSRVQPVLPASGAVAPPHVGAQGGFATGGAMRTPQTLVGPVAPAAAVKPVAKAAKRKAKAATGSKGVKAGAAPVAPVTK